MNIHYRGKYSEQDKTIFESAQEEDLIKICNYLKTDPSISDKIKFEIFL